MEIIGHEQILAALKRARDTNAFHHAYLFAGPDGVGKRRVAEWVAALVNCMEPSAPCGACRSCRRVLDPDAAHPDVVILEPEGRQITIAQVRALIRTIPYPPIEAAYRVVIIDPADAIGEAAANALLKTLEEPPSKTRFILVSSRPDALLITIRSRCQRIAFGHLTEEEVLSGLVDADVPGEEARAMAIIADGSLGTALALASDPLVSRREELCGRLIRCPPGDIAEAFAIAQQLGEESDKMTTVFGLLKRLYRDLLLITSGAEETLSLTFPGLLGEMRERATELGAEGVLYRLELIEETLQALVKRNINMKLALERLATSLTAPPGESRARLHPHLIGRAT